MADLLINSTTYTGIESVSIPTTSNGTSRFKLDAEIKTGGKLLEYLDTTGTGCVDLGMYFTYPSSPGHYFHMKLGVLDSSTTQVVCGTGTVGTTATDQLVFVSGKIRTDRVQGSILRYPISVNDIIDYSFGGGSSSKGLIAADLVSSNTFGGAVNTSVCDIANPERTMLLFGEHSGTGYGTYAKVRFYEMLYSEGGVEVVHLFPALDSNNVKCLYDTVSKNYFYSENGAFE